MGTIIDNVKHVPSTIGGSIVAGLGIALSFMDPATPTGQLLGSVAAGHPHFAGALGILAGLGVILGVGPAKQQ